MIKQLTLAALVAAAPFGAYAADPVGDALADVDGREVQATGNLHRISALRGHQVQIGRNFYPVTFALGRDDLRRVEVCDGDLFGGVTCDISGTFEIRVNGDQITLTLFDLLDLATRQH